MAFVVETSLAAENNGEGREEEEEDGESRGEWVTVKPQPSTLFTVLANQSQLFIV